MPLLINSDSGSVIIEITSVTFDNSLNTFSCLDNEGNPVFQVQIPFILEEMPSADYTEKIYFFKNHLFPSKRKVSLEFKRPGVSRVVGYIFTIDDILKSPEIFENIHLKKMVFNVILKLLQGKDISVIPKVSAYRHDSDYRLSDFYDDDSILVAVCDQFVDFEGYDFLNYIASFYEYGFRFCPFTGFYPNDSEVNLVLENYRLINNRLKLSAPQNNLIKNYFIRTLITNEIYLKENEVARFHLLYQVLEMLMEKVLKNEISDEICNKLNDLSGYDAKDFFRELMRDSYSLGKLVGDNYTSVSENIKTELSENIVNLFTYTKVVVASDFNTLPIANKIYKVRNILFHSYSKILSDTTIDKSNTENLLKRLNDSFEYLVLGLITSFKK